MLRRLPGAPFQAQRGIAETAPLSGQALRRPVIVIALTVSSVQIFTYHAIPDVTLPRITA